MFSNSVRLILITVSILAAILTFYSRNFYLGGLFVISAILFAYGYFRYGAISKAFQNLQAGKNKQAENLISSIKYPNLLAKQQKGFYFFIKAVLEQDKRNLDVAESFYLNALELGVKTKNNEAIINLKLAKIFFEKKLLDFAKERLQKASSLSDKKEIDIEIKKLSLQLET